MIAINKFIFGFGASLLTLGVAYAQENNPLDISRYSESDLNGTARFRGMSGAFGAVGGDLSALKINPAGGAIFNYNHASFSTSYVNKNNKTNYLNSDRQTQNYNGLDLGQAGAIFVFNSNDPRAKMKKFVIGINYESTKNLYNDYRLLGTGQTNSLGEYFYNHATFNAVPHAALDNEFINEGYMKAGDMSGFSGQQAFLGYESFLIDRGQEDGTYIRNFGDKTNTFTQGKYVSSSGLNSKFSGNFAAQLGDRIFVGGNLNLHVFDYTQTSHAVEINRNTLDKDMIKSVEFSNYLYTYGAGFSFNLGVIGQVTDQLRAGIAYESPTWYNLHDELTQGIQTTNYANKDYYTYPQVVNIYDRYKLQTPAKYTGSLAYIFNQKGLISVDYGIRDHSKTTFRPKKDYTYSSLNDFYKAEMKAASELRIGAEYRLKQVSFRAGYRYEESPYKNIKYSGDLNSFSAGIGYEFGNSRLDLAYTHSARDYKTSVLDMKVNNLYDNATWKMKENWVTLSYNISF